MSYTLRTYGQLLLGAACCVTRPAAAEGLSSVPTLEPSALELDVRYEADPGCPASSEFLRALSEHLGAGGEGVVAADVRITRSAPAALFELRLRLRVAGRDFTSVTSADRCEDLVHLAALNAALARGPHPLVATADSVSATSFDADAPGLRLGSDPSESLAPPTRIEPAATPFDTAAAPAPREADRSSWHWLALAELRAAGAMFPRWVRGQGAGLGLARDPWSLRLGATWWQPDRETFSADGAAPLAIEFAQTSIELAPCWAPAVLPALHLGGCALIAGHRIQTNQQTSVLGTLGVGTLGSLRLWEGLHLEARAALEVTTSRPEFGIGALRHVYRPGVVSPLISFALGWEFGMGADP